MIKAESVKYLFELNKWYKEKAEILISSQLLRYQEIYQSIDNMDSTCDRFIVITSYHSAPFMVHFTWPHSLKSNPDTNSY